MARIPLLSRAGFRTEPWLLKRSYGYPSPPIILSVIEPASRTAGGVSVTITGRGFLVNNDGTSPTVTFGGVAATSVVVVSSTSITCTVPAATQSGSVDVVVICKTGMATLTGGFLYYSGQISSLSPSYATIAGGVAIIVRGAAFIAGSTFTVDGEAVTDTTFIDDTHYSFVVPAHAVGYVDVVMTEIGGATSTLRNGLQFTELVRGSDIRRNPGMAISKTLGGTPNSASFSIDGKSQKPSTSEEIHLTDEQDGNRELFAGVITNVRQKYEGQTNQLVWACTATDFNYLLNKYRPFGSFVNVSASEVVRTLMGKYAPSFNLSFVQTNLALITIAFDGTKTMAEALDAIGQAIGGGRWYLLSRALHFFNPPLPATITVPAGSTGTGADFTAPTISVGATTGAGNQTYSAGYYAVRCTFLYSNGVESRLGPASNVVAFDGTKFIHIANLPIGLNPSASITCIGRKIYYLRGSSSLASGWTVNDNATTSIDVYPNMVNTGVIVDNFDDPVTVSDSGTEGADTQVPAGPISGLGVQNVLFVSVNGSPYQSQYGYPNNFARCCAIMIGGHPNDDNLLNATNFFQGGGFVVAFLPEPGWYRVKCSAIYPDGLESSTSEGSLPATYFASIDAGQQNIRNFNNWIPTPPVFAAIKGNKPIKFRWYVALTYSAGRPTPINPSDFTPAIAQPGKVIIDGQLAYQRIGECPYYEDTILVNGKSVPAVGGVALDTATTRFSSPSSADFGDKPRINPDVPEQTLQWPNPDGPYLEDFDLPPDIDDLDTDLLHEDSGSQGFEVEEEISQLRNRVKVFGASTTTTADAVIGDAEVLVADPSIFSVNGGKIVAANGVSLDFFSTSSAIAGDAALLLREPLAADIPAGTLLQYFSQADDLASQRERGKIELDENGDPTDGVHEYVISDPSLASIQQVYLRAQAEIAVYGKPILTIRYATRNAKHRPGARVNVDLTNPPCKGTFLIQTVDIDQIHDESDMLFPRYTCVATNKFFDLTNFLMSIAAGSQVSGGGGDGQSSAAPGGGGNTVGQVAAASNQALTAAQTSLISATRLLDITKGHFSYSAFNATNGSWTLLLGSVSVSFSGGVAAGTLTLDSRGTWARCTSSALVGNSAGYSQTGTFLRAEHNCRTKFYMRTGASLAGCRLWIVIAASSPTNADTPASKMFGLRFSTVALDTGIRAFTYDGTTLQLGDPILGLSTNSEYLVTVESVGGGAQMTVTIQDVNGTVYTSTLTMPALILNTNISPHGIIFTVESVSKTLDFLHIGFESGLN